MYLQYLTYCFTHFFMIYQKQKDITLDSTHFSEIRERYVLFLYHPAAPLKRDK